MPSSVVNPRPGRRRVAIGTLFAVLAGCCWSISGIVGQLFIDHYEHDVLWITSMRLPAAGLALLAVSAIKDPHDFFSVWGNKRDYPVVALYSLAGMFGAQIFYFMTIKLSNSAAATLLQYCAPVFVLLYVAIFRREKPTLLAAFFVLLAIAGVFLLLTGGDAKQLHLSLLSLLTGVLSAVAAAVYSVSPVRLLPKYGALKVSGWGMLIAGIASNVLYPVWKVRFQMTWISAGYIAVIVIIGTAMAFVLAMLAVQRVSPLVFNVATATEPVLTVILSLFIFGLTLSGYSVAAIALVVASVVALSLAESKK